MTPATVLVVDDDEDIRRLISFALERVGHFRVRLAADAQQALALVQEERPDVVLLDVSMPVADGPQTLSLMRAIPSMRDVPIAFLTAGVEISESDSPNAHRSVAALLRAGACDVIAKPFVFEELCERVRRLVPPTVVR